MDTHNKTKNSKNNEEEPPLLYGFCGCSPKILQGLLKPVWFLVFMCFGNVFQSMLVNGLIGVILSSLETRFDLTSSSRSVYEVGEKIPTRHLFSK